MIILRDDFTGSGDLAAHAPSIQMFGSGWTDLSGSDAPFLIPFGLGSGEARPNAEAATPGDPRQLTRYSLAWTGKALGSSIPSSAAKQAVSLEAGIFHRAYAGGNQPSVGVQLFTPFTGSTTSAPSDAGVSPALGFVSPVDDGLYLRVDRVTSGEYPAYIAVVFGVRVGGVSTDIFSATLTWFLDFFGDAELSATIFDDGVHTFRGEFSSSAQAVIIDGVTVWTGNADYTSLTRSVRGLTLSHNVGEYHLTGGPAGGRFTGIDYVQVEASGVTASDFWTTFRGAHEVLEAP